MATSASASQLGVAGIQSILELFTEHSVSATMPAPEDVTSIHVDGGDVTVHHAGGELVLAFNNDMELDFINRRLNILSLVNLDGDIPAQSGDALIHDGTGFAPTPLSTIVSQATLSTQGYYGLLTNFYFVGGQATETTISDADVDNWVDVEFTVDTDGKFDQRPLAMKAANAGGHTGTGNAGDPIVLSLEGLDTHGHANFRASMAFTPEEDEGQLETRLLFSRHSGTTPSDDFSIEEVSLSMDNGADIEYPSEPMLSFFVGDTIDTNGAGDAGTCKFQVKSTVAGVVSMRALTWYINV